MSPDLSDATSTTPPSRLPIHSITPGQHNRSLSEEGLTELTESIRAVGVIEPIIVRPLVQLSITQMADWQDSGADLPKWEIVCGERRWHSATRAGLTHIPCIVRSLDDAQAAEIRLHENLEREGLNALDEGLTMRILIQQHGMAIDALATRTGKSRSHVYARLRIAEHLCPYVQSVLRAGKLDAETALLIARIPNPKLQIQAADEVQGQPYRAAKETIRARYSTDLKRVAGWDLADATLVESAGACTTCPHRSGNDPTDDSSNPDVCISPDCFGQKRVAHWRRKLHDEWAANGYQPTEVEFPHDLSDGYHSAIERSGRHGFVYQEMAERMERAGWLQPYQMRALFTAALIRASSVGPSIVQMISHESAIRLDREYSLYLDAHKPTPSTAAQARAEAPPEGEGDDGETSVATPRDRSAEEPGPLTRGKGDRTEGGVGLAADDARRERECARRDLALQLVRAVLRDRGEREHDDLVMICVTLLTACGEELLSEMGLPLWTSWDDPTWQGTLALDLSQRTGAELARIATATAIYRLDPHGDGDRDPYPDDQLRMLALRFLATEGTSQSVDAADASNIQLVDVSAPRTRPLKRQVKYRHPTTGETWTGKGLQPAWFKQEMDAGRSISDFEVSA